MSIAARPRAATAINQSFDPRVLGTIAMPGVGAAIWQRDVAPRLLKWLEELPTDHLPRLRERLRPKDAAAAVKAACLTARTPASPERDAFVVEVSDLVQVAAAQTGAVLVDLRLDSVFGQPCPKWHLDAVRARFLCTLRGAGTEFGPAGSDGDVTATHRVPLGCPAMFRGRDWPGEEVSGILHRSPPTENGQCRFLVVVDPIDPIGTC